MHEGYLDPDKVVLNQQLGDLMTASLRKASGQHEAESSTHTARMAQDTDGKEAKTSELPGADEKKHDSTSKQCRG